VTTARFIWCCSGCWCFWCCCCCRQWHVMPCLWLCCQWDYTFWKIL